MQEMKPGLRRLAVALGAAAVGLGTGAAPAQAQSASAEVLSITCAGCHGPQGHSPGPMPSLYGRTAASIAEILIEFKNGRRPATVMTRIAKGFSDEEIAALAAEVARWK